MPYKHRDRQRKAQRDWVRQKRAKKVRQPQGSTKGSTRARIATVRPSNGTEQDNIRAAGDRLVAALGGPAVAKCEQHRDASYVSMIKAVHNKVPTDTTVTCCRFCGLPADQPSPQCDRH